MKGETPPDNGAARRVLFDALAAAAALTCMAGTTAEAGIRDSLAIRGKQAPYFFNRSLAVRDTDVCRAVIVVHGSRRKVEDTFASIVDNIPSSSDPGSDWRARTIVLAPHFQEKDDARDREQEAWWK